MLLNPLSVFDSAVSLVQTPQQFFPNDIVEIGVFKQNSLDIKLLFANMEFDVIGHHEPLGVECQGVVARAAANLNGELNVGRNHDGSHAQRM